MCGISAYVDIQGPNGPPLQGSAEGRKTELNKSLDIIKHRGPDARGVWMSADTRVGLGHVRLSIVDLSPDGNQPFVDTQDGITAVVNGELYGHEAYYTQLANEYNFQGKSDCEIVIALYKHYGRAFLSHLRGEFAFVLWDSKREVFFAARDRYGIKPLYYTIIDDRLIVATEMKAFLGFGWRPEWCVETLRGYAWKMGTKTFFKGVLPGHYLVCQNYKGGIKQTIYWDTDFPDKRVLETRSEAEMVEGVRERLLEAVRVRLRADVPVGVYLSGGLDSSAIAGIVAHLIKEEGTKLGNDNTGDLSRLRCFTVQFDKDSGADESDVAQRTADWLGVEYHPIPFPDLNGLGKLALSEKVHSLGMKVVLTGEGSDEHFVGYPDFRPDLLQEPDYSWPAADLPPHVREKAWREARDNTGAVIFGDGGHVVPVSTARMVNNTHTMREVAKCGYLPFLPWTSTYLSAGDPETRLAEDLDGRILEMIANKWHPLHTSQYIWLRSYLPNFILRWVGDNMDMAHHVESRPAFLDHHLNQYVNFLPPSLKMRYNPEDNTFNEKYILRQAARPFVTDEIYARRKVAYCGPTQYKENGPVHRVFLRLLTKENIERLGFLDWALTEDYLERAFRQGDRRAFRNAVLIAQFVVIMQRFGVPPASPIPN
ncbi:asparagine synthase [Aspergillus caelatus]|uniref:Asparagine synthase n=1 Tax=Aspergillus caelatus TaxID=61420 RepID=A0A5N7AI45_9EURO|nr:asparagine synthase [Aspergillus caelatus]KAE8369554.1 asparagine synthase [Aspergillus caelatus]